MERFIGLVRVWKELHFIVTEFSTSVSVVILENCTGLASCESSGPIPFPLPIQTAASLNRRNAAIACLFGYILHTL